MNFGFLKLRENIKSAFEVPNLLSSLLIVLIATILIILTSISNISITGIIITLIENFYLLLAFSVIFFVFALLAKKKVNFKQLISSFSFIWFYLIISLLLLGIGSLALGNTPIYKLTAIAKKNNMSLSDSLLMINAANSQDKQLFEAIINKNINQEDRANAMSYFNEFNVWNPLFIIYVILLIISVIFALIALIAIPYLIIREIFKAGIAINIILWIIVWGITLFISGYGLILTNNLIR